MKKLIMLFIVALALGCVSVPTKPTVPTVPTPKEAICKVANEEVKSTKAAANSLATDRYFDMEVESCGLIATTGVGYAIFYVNGYSIPGPVYMGHMKRMTLYVQERGHWVPVKESTLVFLPPPSTPRVPGGFTL